MYKVTLDINWGSRGERPKAHVYFLYEPTESEIYAAFVKHGHKIRNISEWDNCSGMVTVSRINFERQGVR